MPDEFTITEEGFDGFLKGCPGDAPSSYLAYLLLVLCGGESEIFALEQDAEDWIKEVGFPTKELIESWIENNRFSVDIGIAACKWKLESNKRKREYVKSSKIIPSN